MPMLSALVSVPDAYAILLPLRQARAPILPIIGAAEIFPREEEVAAAAARAALEPAFVDHLTELREDNLLRELRKRAECVPEHQRRRASESRVRRGHQLIDGVVWDVAGFHLFGGRGEQHDYRKRLAGVEYVDAIWFCARCINAGRRLHAASFEDVRHRNVSSRARARFQGMNRAARWRRGLRMPSSESAEL